MTPFIADSEVKMPDNVTGNDDAIVEGNKWRHKLPSQQFVISLEKKTGDYSIKIYLKKKVYYSSDMSKDKFREYMEERHKIYKLFHEMKG